MLNKEICRMCLKEHRDWFADYSVVEHVFDSMWIVNRCVSCPMRKEGVCVIDSPPEDCPYITEHIVSQDVE